MKDFLWTEEICGRKRCERAEECVPTCFVTMEEETGMVRYGVATRNFRAQTFLRTVSQQDTFVYFSCTLLCGIGIQAATIKYKLAKITSSNAWHLKGKNHFTKSFSIKTSQELRMLSRSLSECKPLTLSVMIQVSQFVSNSQLCHKVTNSLNHSQSKSKSKSLSLSLLWL